MDFSVDLHGFSSNLDGFTWISVWIHTDLVRITTDLRGLQCGFTWPIADQFELIGPSCPDLWAGPAGLRLERVVGLRPNL